MARIQIIKPRKLFMGKLQHGQDLLDEIFGICSKENITLGRFSAVGAVQQARVGYYNQDSRQYEFLQFDQNLEITNLTGNISIKDGKPFVHAHVTLADKNGNALGGHLASGTLVFACEIIIEAFDGPAFEREFDDETGLMLWNF